MNPAKAVARLNAALLGSGRLEGVPTGRPEITSQDIAHALGMIKHVGACLMGRVMYADQKAYWPALEACLETDVLEAISREGWRVSPADAAGVCRAAVAEFLDPQNCKACAGQMTSPDPRNPALVVVCKVCEGSGKGVWSDRRRAKMAGITRHGWNAWVALYPERVLPILDKYHDIFWSGLKRRLQ